MRTIFICLSILIPVSVIIFFNIIGGWLFVFINLSYFVCLVLSIYYYQKKHPKEPLA